MRMRLDPGIAVALHRAAIRQGRSDQEMADKAISVGLAHLTAGAVTVPTDRSNDDGLPRANDYRVTLAIPSAIYHQLKEIERAEGRSFKGAVRRVLESGLRTELPAPAGAS